MARGHIVQRSDRSYTLVFDIEPHPLTGKRRQRSMTFYGSREDAEAELARLVSEAHKGRIGIVSQPGRGSRFFFELPAIAPHHMAR